MAEAKRILLEPCRNVNYGIHKNKGMKENGKNLSNDHEYVDLGLSVKWAACNVGANKPEEYGDYYAWGETETKSSYDIDNCETWKKGIGDIKGTSRDVAHVKWGSPCRMPTDTEIRELKDNCDWEWTMLNGTNGYKVKGKNGNSIFLPAAGWRGWTSLLDAGKYGNYWSSTPDESDTRDAYNLDFNSRGRYTYLSNKCYYGLSVRPVSEF